LAADIIADAIVGIDEQTFDLNASEGTANNSTGDSLNRETISSSAFSSSPR
jgi:hypothetical protein